MGQRRPPIVVQAGSARVLIYRRTFRVRVGRRLRRYSSFTVTYYQPNGEKRSRIRRCFGSLGRARLEARRVADLLASGEADAVKLTRNDAASYLAALETLRPLGIPLNAAVNEYVEARSHAGAGLIEAAKQYGRQSAFVSTGKTVAEVVSELLADKQQDRMSVRYLQSLRGWLRRFAQHFAMPISSVTKGQIDDWLRKSRTKKGGPLEPRTRNNARGYIVTLFRYAQDEGYLSRATKTEADLVRRAKDQGGEIGIFRPDELAGLLLGTKKHPSRLSEETKLYIAIGAFAGLRTAELFRLDWDEIDFARGHIEVAKSKSKTATRRLVPIQSNLMRWLERYRGSSGPVFSGGAHAPDRAIAEVKTLGVPWPNNVLRHSFATYRLAQTQDAARTSLELGNSPAMLFAHYRELATEQEAKDWFSIDPPTTVANVVQLPRRGQ